MTYGSPLEDPTVKAPQLPSFATDTSNLDFRIALVRARNVPFAGTVPSLKRDGL